MIHWSAVERFGKLAPEDDRLRRYQPENLTAALANGMLIADERLVDLRRRPTPPVTLPAPRPLVPAATGGPWSEPWPK